MAGLLCESPSCAHLSCPGHFRSWDLNKICYKSGIPLIENGMIERVSILSLGQGGASSASRRGF